MTKAVKKKIPNQLKAKVKRELEPGEKIQWADMPVPHFLTVESIITFLFGIPWMTISLIAVFGAIQSRDVLGYFFLLPFLLIGIGFLSCPLWVYRMARNTIYVITDRRAITIDGCFTYTIRSYEPNKLQHIYRKERRDKSGDVIILYREWRDSDGESNSEELGFLGIENPKEVEAMLKRLADRDVKNENRSQHHVSTIRNTQKK